MYGLACLGDVISGFDTPSGQYCIQMTMRLNFIIVHQIMHSGHFIIVCVGHASPAMPFKPDYTFTIENKAKWRQRNFTLIAS
jgi:hypothetical protein